MRCRIFIRNGLNNEKIFEGLSRVEITVCWDVIPFRHCHSSDGKSLDSHGVVSKLEQIMWNFWRTKWHF